jgi:hypothetical protein
MKTKKLIAIALIVALACPMLASCSKESTVESPETQIVEVTDADDTIKVTVDPEAKTTFELTDLEGNVLTVVPVYNSDGVTIIAGYIQSAKDKDGNALDEKAYANLKTVIALEFDTDNNCSIKYDENKKFITLTALADEKGYIIALQDALDLDNDKDTSEYFQAVTKLDSDNTLFIKLDKDEKGNLINVEVKTDSNGSTTVTTNDGKTQTAKKSTESQNLGDLKSDASGNKDSSSDNSNKSQSSNKSSNSNTGKNNNTEQTDPEVDYVSIVLKKGGKISCDADNVSLIEDSTGGGAEIIVDGAGDYSKYYITSETDTYCGQIEFRLNIGDDVEVKFNDVSMSTAKKTAVKFTDVDKENDKESDTEESGSGTNQSGSDIDAPAPTVELSFTGTNSFKASGSGKNGTIYSECKLGIKGHGSATIDGGQNLSGICSTESMTIKNATLNITSSAKQGISCDRKVTVESGATINISSKGDGIHCNKFEYNGDDTSSIIIKSLYDSDCADGIDANTSIIINGGTLDVTAPTSGKYALKVRKILKDNTNGVFVIEKGSVTASGSNNTTPTACAQETSFALIKSSSATQFTLGGLQSYTNVNSYLVSPCSETSVSNSSGTTKDIAWSGNIGTASF